MNRTSIEYLTHTWNPIAMRCTPISEGCAHCWHLRLADRFAKNPNFPPEVRAAYAGEGPPILVDKRLEEPLHKRGSARIGVQFMGDLFHDDIPFKIVDEVWRIMDNTPQHTYLILTKRPSRMLRYWHHRERLSQSMGAPFSNVLLGVTAENQEQADKRIPILLQVPAAKRFVSIEPMLSPVNLKKSWLYRPRQSRRNAAGIGGYHPMSWIEHPISWIVCGGESGSSSRPMHPNWARSLRNQCQTSGIPFHFKQFGDYITVDQAIDMGLHTSYERSHGEKSYTYIEGFSMPFVRVSKKAAGRLLDGKLWDEYPE